MEEVADLLELTPDLGKRARRLSADAKQKISLGRGLVRPDVAALLLDEPLTVIDPRLKWLLRRKLKQIHQQLAISLIYVTHDQTEALTFADQVVVMTEGEVVQTGTRPGAVRGPRPHLRGALHRQPRHELPRPARSGTAPPSWRAWRSPLPDRHRPALEAAGPVQLGIRPERVEVGGQPLAGGHAARLLAVQPLGAHTLCRWSWPGTGCGPSCRRGASPALQPGPGWVRLPPEHILVYGLGERQAGRVKPVTQRAWLLVLPVVLSVAFSAVLPLMTVVNYSVQDILGPDQKVYVGIEWFRQVLRDGDLHAALGRQLLFSLAALAIQIPLGIALALAMPAAGWRASLHPHRCWPCRC